MTRLIVVVVILLTAVTASAQDAAFWLWFIEYSDENGVVFDPLALELTDSINKLEQADDENDNEVPNEISNK